MTGSVILDRDGVINDHQNYVNTPDDFHLFSTAGPSIRRLNDAGFKVYVATNQGGVGLGYMTMSDIQHVHDTMQEQLAVFGATLEDIAVCPHAPHAGCSCRKPKPGMLLQLSETHGFNLKESYMVGDRETDVQAGQRAGCKTIFIGSGPSAADWTANDLAEAVERILLDKPDARYDASP